MRASGASSAASRHGVNTGVIERTHLGRGKPKCGCLQVDVLDDVANFDVDEAAVILVVAAIDDRTTRKYGKRSVRTHDRQVEVVGVRRISTARTLRSRARSRWPSQSSVQAAQP